VFGLFIAFLFVAFNFAFAGIYMACGEDALVGLPPMSPAERFLQMFFFSVQTSTTIGYGVVAPHSLAANTFVSLEVMLGLLGFAVGTGLLFARVSRPVANIVFSKNAVVAPYKGGRGLMFRIANSRKNELINVELNVVLTRVEAAGDNRRRVFHQLALERSGVMFLPLSWTIVHPIVPGSPLYGLDSSEFFASDPEVMVLITAVDESFSQTVHARSSYREEEILWGAKFGDMFQKANAGIVSVDLRKLHDTVPADLPVQA
jgi:inward rectifier potassium channel